MSGPKVSVYSLTPAQIAAIQARLRRQQEELERQRREREERRRLELERKRREQEKIKALKSQLTMALGSLDAVSGKVAEYWQLADESQLQISDSSLADLISEVSEKINSLAADIKASTEVTELAPLEEASSRILQRKTQIDSQIKKLQSEAKKAEGRIGKAVSSRIEGLFKTINSAAPVDSQPVESVLIRDTRQRLEQLNSSEWLTPALKQQLASIASRLETVNPTIAKSFMEIEVQPFFRRCQEFSDLWEKYGQEYKELSIRYEALAQMNGHESQIKMIPFSEQAAIELKKLIAVEEAFAQAEAEQAYISDTLNDVMSEMGYDIWGRKEVTKRSGKHFKKSLYHYGTDSAINVTYADNGQITMELGAVDGRDRLPSSEETVQLTERMVSFCDDFAEIERRLNERGVCIKNRIALSPPSATYAQVINIHDYDVVASTSQKEESARRSATKQKKRQIDAND